MKKIISLILCVAMMCGALTAFAGFEDVDTKHINYEAIETLESLGVVNGTSENEYDPNKVLTRAEFATMMVRAIGVEGFYPSFNCPFSDVSVNDWYYSYVNLAYDKGIIRGYGDGTFGPADSLTYTQTARIILNILGYPNNLEWPIGVDYVAYELGLYDNVNFGYNTSNVCTRAHAAQMIYNAFDLNLVKSYTYQPTSKTFLKDVLGYKKTDKAIDGQIYVAYKNIETGKVITTDIEQTYSEVIYPSYGKGGDFGYGYKLSKKGKTIEVNWYWVADKDLPSVYCYVNGVEITEGSEKWFANCESAIGIFDGDDNLVAIHITNEGNVWVPYTGKHNENAKMPQEMYDEVIADKNFDEDTSTVTYFLENGEYIISNHVEYGKVTDYTSKSIYIGDIRYNLDEIHSYKEGDFVVIFFDYEGNIADHDFLKID